MEDPRQKWEKIFEFHLISPLTKVISKCCGSCGEPMTQKYRLLVQSYNNKTWKDLKTQVKMSRYEPVYIHFKGECLKAYGTNKCYASFTVFNQGICLTHLLKIEPNSTETSFEGKIYLWNLLVAISKFLFRVSKFAEEKVFTSVDWGVSLDVKVWILQIKCIAVALHKDPLNLWLNWKWAQR